MRRLIVLALALAGCAEVDPWERETIASERMRLDTDPDEHAMVSSRRRTREEGTVTAGGVGSSSTGGAGCGCN